MHAHGLESAHVRGQIAFVQGFDPSLARVTTQPRLLRFVPANWIQSVDSLPGGRDWLKSAEVYLRACGCNESAGAALLSMPLGVAAAYWVATSSGVVFILQLLGSAVAAFVLGAIAGKLFGLALARKRYRRATRRWLAALTAQDQQEPRHV